MTAKKRSENRVHAPKPELLDGDVREKAAPPKGLTPDEKKDEGDSILDELEFVEGEPPIDLNDPDLSGED